MNLAASHWLSPARARQFRRYLRDLKLTIICGFLTILVLRGILGGDKFGTPLQDFEDIKQLAGVHGLHRKQLPSRAVVEEVATENFRQNVKIHRIPNEVDEKDADGLRIAATLPLIQISDSGTQRSNNLKLASLKQTQKRKVMLFLSGSQSSSCADDPKKDHQLLVKSMKNKLDYCRLHHMEMFYAAMATGDDTAAPMLSGVMKEQEAVLMREVMVQHPEVEWIWWMHRDTMVTDMEFEVRMEKYEGYNMVLYGSVGKEMDLQNRDHHQFRQSFLLRNCAWSLNLLEGWADSYSKKDEEDSDKEVVHQKLQNNHTSLLYFLSTQMKLQRLNTDKVLVENSPSILQVYESSQYPPTESTHSISLEDESGIWPFLTHFAGNCKPPCHLNGNGQMQRNNSAAPCFQQMQKAFNFADNQVLQIYGFHHNSLSSDGVSRLEDGFDRKQSFL